MRDQTVVQLDDVVARRPPEPGAPVAHREPQRGAESPRIERRPRVHDRLAPSPEAPERVGHELDLGRHLAGVLERGEVTPAAAVGDVRAPGCDPVRRRLDDAHDRAAVGPVAPADRDLDQLAGECVVDQHDLPVVPPGQRRTARDQPLGPHDHRFVVRLWNPVTRGGA